MTGMATQQTYSYDATGKLLQLIAAANSSAPLTTVNVWNGDDLGEVQYKDASGNIYKKVIYTYFTSGVAYRAPSSITHVDTATGAQRVTSYSYTAGPSGLLSSKTETQALPGGNAVTTYSYDDLGNLISETNPLGTRYDLRPL